MGGILLLVFALLLLGVTCWASSVAEPYKPARLDMPNGDRCYVYKNAWGDSISCIAADKEP
jgi:hypothetical protein